MGNRAKQFGILYKPRLAVKGQALADFLAELPHPERVKEANPSKWVLFVDGASRSGGAGIGILLVTPTGERVE